MKLLKLFKRIKNMIELKESNFVKMKLDKALYMKTKDDWTVVIDKVMKEKVKAK